MTRPVPEHPPTLWELIVRRAAATPDAVMFEDEQGRSMTFEGYRGSAEVVAAGLLDHGVGPGTVVSWQLPTAIDTVVLLAALARLGAVQSPIIPILREREVRYITRESRCELLVVRPTWRGFDFEALADTIAADVGFRVLACGDGELPVGDPALLPPPPGPEPVRRWLYYTSGSTADPKGVWHVDASVMAGMNAWVAELVPTADDIYPIAFPIAHIGGINMIAASLVAGHRIVLIEAFDPERSPELMAERGATMLGSALPFFQAYLAAQRRHGAEPLYPALRACVNGGAPKPAGLHEEVKRELGGLGVIGSWGLTEFPIATSGGFDDDDFQLATTEGVAGPGVEIRVVGIDGTEQPPGAEGELRLRGPQLFQGYANPELDLDAFDDDGFFRTGDLGTVAPTGHVTITGRVKDVIIRNAENISAGEIEDILHLHPSIVDVAVIGLPDPRTGERACAVVRLADGVTTLTLADIADHCRAQGLATQKIPEQLELVDDVPRNAMGKIEKPALRRRYAASPRSD